MIESPVRSLSERDWYPGAAMGYAIANTETLSARGLRSAYVPSYIAKLRSKSMPTAPWLSATISRLIELTERQPNWDSYGALPADPEVAELAASFLTILAQADAIQAPHIGGLNDGSVQLEWYRNGRDLRLTFGADRQVGIFYSDAASHELWDGRLVDDPVRFATLLVQVGA